MGPDLLSLGLVAVGGALGGAARHFVSGAVARRIGERFPWGTLAVNLSGAAAVGGLAAALAGGGAAQGAEALAWVALVTGFLGAYTTVSSFSLQTLALVRNGETGRAALNVAGSVAGTLAAAAAGFGGVALLLGS